MGFAKTKRDLRAILAQKDRDDPGLALALLEQIGRHGPRLAGALARALGKDSLHVGEVLTTNSWFDLEADGYHLSDAGQRAWNCYREHGQVDIDLPSPRGAKP